MCFFGYKVINIMCIINHELIPNDHVMSTTFCRTLFLHYFFGGLACDSSKALTPLPKAESRKQF